MSRQKAELARRPRACRSRDSDLLIHLQRDILLPPSPVRSSTASRSSGVLFPHCLPALVTSVRALTYAPDVEQNAGNLES